MSYSITKKNVPRQQALVQRKKASAGPEMSQAIGEALGAVFAHAHTEGMAITGRPFARYLEVGPGPMTFEPGVFVSSPADDDEEGDGVRLVTIPGGEVAATLHRGPYDELHQAYAAIEAWMKSERLLPGGAPWEVYLTDPTEVEDPGEWETEVYWPVA